ncbi:T9SS type A sorting domain-containing protein [Aquimarina mytili]|uniref:T9SS type A sorting domain-containing protein n=1 Tax=Aquimarina mytili TaxID=874423 RepID=A0A936ZUI6_9FLAO|nr:T9SS type A sorting domain-containing protein [Aquimarina mytili]MBL0682401.1 T9SS type A sorting domain-containing protein [Aquimarina mytili]
MSNLTRKLNEYNQKMAMSTFSSMFCSYMLMTIFIISASFTMVANENTNDSFINEPSTLDNTCMLSVDAGDDVEFCGSSEVTLTATVSGESECTDCLEYGIENTYRCGKDLYYVLWLKDDANNIVRRFSNVDLKWKELPDGTATLKGTVVDNNDAQITLEVDVTYTGRTTSTPSGSPKDHFCNTEDSNGWIYYTGVSGTISQTDGSWSFDITRMGPAFQLGNGANVTEDVVGKYGASGWFNTTDSDFTRGDFNINIGPCISSETSDVTYLWSTGETTQSITVSPQESTSYTVTVIDCEDCEASDTVQVIIKDGLQVDAGEDQNICKGQETTLTATVTGEGECVECVDYSVGDTDYCRGRQHQFVVFINDNGTRLWMRNESLVWKENADGTATLKGNVFEYNSTNTTFVVDAVFSGRTTTPPVGSPKANLCQAADASDWVYYTEISGTVTQVDGSLSYDISRRGEAFQVGAGANVFEYTADVFGASGWFNLEGNPTSFGDFNINLECVKFEPKGIEYLWSTGETTQSITVSPEVDTTYSVTVDGCNGCGEATDEVLVTVSDGITFDLGEDQVVCIGQFTTLTSPIEGDTYLWSTGETTRSITVQVFETLTYTLEVTKDGCSGTDDIVVELRFCEGRGAVDLYPTVLKSSGDLSLAVYNQNAQEVKISIHDLTGVAVGPVLIKNVSKGQDVININLEQYSKISSGMYVVMITDSNGKTTTRRMIIE